MSGSIIGTKALEAAILSLISGIPSVNISALNIDWSAGNLFFKNTNSNSAFTFSNLVDGKTISVLVRNTGLSAITVSFPYTLGQSDIPLSVAPSSGSVYSFSNFNGVIAVTCVSEMVSA